MDYNPNIKKNIEYLLHFAKTNQLDEIKLFIEERNVDVNSTDNVGSTALHEAALRGYDAIVEYLLSKGANIDAKTVSDKPTLSGITPLIYAVRDGHVNTAKILLDHGANVDIIPNNYTLLGIAVTTDNSDLISLVLDCGVDINASHGEGSIPPLSLALAKGKYQSARFLLEKGADYRKCCSDGFFPLIFAAKKEEGSEGVELLLKHVEEKEGKEKLLEYVNYNGADNGCTALHVACIVKNYHAAKALLEHGADYKIRDKEGSKPRNLISGRSHVCNHIMGLLGAYAQSDLAKGQSK